MAKDAQGHGSDGRGGSGMVKVSVTRPIGYTIHNVGPGGVKTLAASGGQPMSSNADAAQSLMSGLKSTQAPIHDAWSSTPGGDREGDIHPNDPRVGSRDYDAMGHPRDALAKSDYDEASRDMSLRSRNGQFGSGMKFRG